MGKNARIRRSITSINHELDLLLEQQVISEKAYNLFRDNLPSVKDYQLPDYVVALYRYKPEQPDDLEFKEGDKIQILEKLSADWYKGRLHGATGMVPANYVRVVDDEDSNDERSSRVRASSPTQSRSRRASASSHHHSRHSSYSRHGSPDSHHHHSHHHRSSNDHYYGQSAAYTSPPPNGPPPAIQVQAAPPVPYSSQYSPYYQPQPAPVPMVQQQPVVIEQRSAFTESPFENFGSKLGNAAIFGAGSAIGSDIVNSIF